MQKQQRRDEFKILARTFFEKASSKDLEILHQKIIQLIERYTEKFFSSGETLPKILGIYKPLRYELPVKEMIARVPQLNEVPLAYPEYNPQEMWFVKEDNGTHCAPDFFIVPGLFVDRNGYRLGRGKGYYDRYFAAHPTPLPRRVFLGYPFQFIDAVPHDVHDVTVVPLSPVNSL
ncbi:MAG TPA: 5-formyltetrahydrofolate cyclo-ligase [Turneriella sp.]|nr:5-formyltetrahydrofolate cyclo-ligase [Turneriella sp.]